MQERHKHAYVVLVFKTPSMNTESLSLHQPLYARLFSIRGRVFFPVICLLISLNIYINNRFIFTRDLFYQTFGEQVAFERIQSFLDMRDRLAWVGYACVPVILLIKASFTALCIDIGLLFTKRSEPVSFKKLFKVALVGELAFVSAIFIKSAWIYFLIEPGTLTDVQHFYPLSLGFLLDGMPQWLTYPLLTINLFELAYVLLLAAGLNIYMGKGYRKAFTITLFSYLTGLLLWSVLVMFFSINLS
jgi:hypothetical protein